jgi:hypothetical protein
MTHEDVVRTWLTELAVSSRHRARRERANEEALSAAPRKEDASVGSGESAEPRLAA